MFKKIEVEGYIPGGVLYTVTCATGYCCMLGNGIHKPTHEWFMRPGAEVDFYAAVWPLPYGGVSGGGKGCIPCFESLDAVVAKKK